MNEEQALADAKLIAAGLTAAAPLLAVIPGVNVVLPLIDAAVALMPELLGALGLKGLPQGQAAMSPDEARKILGAV